MTIRTQILVVNQNCLKILHPSTHYCVAVGGDTAPLVEVGLEYIQGEESVEVLPSSV